MGNNLGLLELVAMKYHGITYPRLFDRPQIHRLWKRFLCSINFHLFDEVASCGGYLDDGSVLDKKYNHYLVCDACGLVVTVGDIEKTEE